MANLQSQESVGASLRLRCPACSVPPPWRSEKPGPCKECSDLAVAASEFVGPPDLLDCLTPEEVEWLQYLPELTTEWKRVAIRCKRDYE